jgi:hypothetical protein
VGNVPAVWVARTKQQSSALFSVDNNGTFSRGVNTFEDMEFFGQMATAARTQPANLVSKIFRLNSPLVISPAILCDGFEAGPIGY